MQTKRVCEWVKTLERPCVVELRFREGEIVDYVQLPATDDVNIESLVEDLETSASDDAYDAGKTRVYTLVAVDEKGQRWLCPIKVRVKIEKGQTELIQTLVKCNNELQEQLRKNNNDGYRQLKEFTELLVSERRELLTEVQGTRARSAETFKAWEEAKSKQLERDMERERHEKGLETQQRITDAVVPLALAIGNRLTRGALPAPDIRDVTLVEIARSMTEPQLDALRAITRHRWEPLRVIIENALEGRADVDGFRRYALSLTDDERIQIAQVLNVGQQAALQELLTNDNAQN